MIERVEPSVDRLIAHIEEKTDYRQPQPVAPAEVAEDGEGE